MAMTQQQRDEKRRTKATAVQEEDLRMKARSGTRQALAEIMEWAEVEENGEAMTLLIHRIHELGPEAAATSSVRRATKSSFRVPWCASSTSSD